MSGDGDVHDKDTVIKRPGGLLNDWFRDAVEVPPALERVVQYVKSMDLDMQYSRRNVHLIEAIVERSASIIRSLNESLTSQSLDLETNSTASSESDGDSYVIFYNDLNVLTTLEEVLQDATTIIHGESRYTYPDTGNVDSWSKAQRHLRRILSRLNESDLKPTFPGWDRQLPILTALDTATWAIHICEEVSITGTLEGLSDEGLHENSSQPVSFFEIISSPTLLVVKSVASRLEELLKLHSMDPESLTVFSQAIACFVWMAASHASTPGSITSSHGDQLRQLFTALQINETANTRLECIDRLRRAINIPDEVLATARIHTEGNSKKIVQSDDKSIKKDPVSEGVVDEDAVSEDVTVVDSDVDEPRKKTTSKHKEQLRQGLENALDLFEIQHEADPREPHSQAVQWSNRILQTIPDYESRMEAAFDNSQHTLHPGPMTLEGYIGTDLDMARSTPQSRDIEGVPSIASPSDSVIRAPYYSPTLYSDYSSTVETLEDDRAGDVPQPGRGEGGLSRKGAGPQDALLGPPQGRGERGRRGRGSSLRGSGDRAAFIGGRGRGAGRGGPLDVAALIQSGVIQPNPTTVSIAEGVAAIGVKRLGFGTAGRPAIVDTNCFHVTMRTGTIYQYDVGISPQTARARKMQLIRDMFNLSEFQAVSPVKGIYDRGKQYFSATHIGEACQFQIPMSQKTYVIKLKLLAELNPSVLARYTRGETSRDHTEEVDTVLAAHNVAIRMRLEEEYDLHNRHSFFVPGAQTQDMYFRGRQWAGMQMIRGFFQSIRPVMGRTMINIDIATGVVVTERPLVVKFAEFMGKGTLPVAAACNEFRRADKRSFQQAANTLRGMKFYPEDRSNSRLVIRAFTVASAQQATFSRNGTQMTVARYYREKGTPLQYPDLICVEVRHPGSKDSNCYPLEVCTVPTQLLARQVDKDQIADVLRFSALNPHVRLQRIREAFQFLQYEGSPWLQDFGININWNPLRVQARIIPPPQLQFGGQARVTPRDGTWRAQKLFNTVTIRGAMLLVYDRHEPQEFFEWLNRGCQTVGIPIDTKVAPYTRLLDPAQPDVVSDIQRSLKQFKQLRKTDPNLILVVLPDEPKTLYNAVKYAGDVILGIATQCMKVGMIWKYRGRDEYFVNLCLKINVKLGGTNIIPQPAISSEQTPTLFLGANVMHSKSPGEEGLGRPSFCGVTGSIDIHGCKYAGVLKAQQSRVDMIQPLEEMVTTILTQYKESKNPGGPPKRVIYFRDGVAENQFKNVIQTELPQIRKACSKLGMKGFKLTCVIVGKRHHFRAIPADSNRYKRDENALAGTVIDTVVTSPIEFDYYLLGQPGLQGTSRPAHYNVLVDENNFTADEMQQLSFNLCHIYARSTRSVSLPAPVYYAHLLCARAATRYDPRGDFNLDKPLPKGLPEAEKEAWLQRYMDAFKDVHQNMLRVMYFL